MLATLVTWLAKLGFGNIVERTISLLEHRASEETEREKLKTQIAIEVIRGAVHEAEIMAEFNREKLRHRGFWVLIYCFAGGLCLWWNAVILDSIFHFGWQVADLPTVQMQDWAGNMIQWIFYVGGGVAGLRVLVK